MHARWNACAEKKHEKYLKTVLSVCCLWVAIKFQLSFCFLGGARHNDMWVRRDKDASEGLLPVSWERFLVLPVLPEWCIAPYLSLPLVNPLPLSPRLHTPLLSAPFRLLFSWFSIFLPSCLLPVDKSLPALLSVTPFAGVLLHSLFPVPLLSTPVCRQVLWRTAC